MGPTQRWRTSQPLTRLRISLLRQYAGHLLYESAKARGLPVSVVGVPKSIDNDILFIDKTFGFDSAVAAASRVIKSGWVEATSCKKGVGIVKLMGRDAGVVGRCSGAP